jgi:D-alanyl-D-alanine carboxypeptidase/D-alanyl-D-alanine-endopeptidase (penicillin-binding protein 4)
MSMLSRRELLGGLLAGTALVALPQMSRAQSTIAPSAALIRGSGLSGDIGFVVADLRTGQVLESYGASKAMPPASALKAITSLYALENLGSQFRFGTRLVATGPVAVSYKHLLAHET